MVIDAGHGGKDSGALSDKKGSLKRKRYSFKHGFKTWK